VVVGNNVISQAYTTGNVQDPNLKWESTNQYNVGFDLGMFHDRIQLIANFYDSRSFNLLVNNNISAVSGSTSILTNLQNSRIRNQGFDIQVDGKVIQNAGGFNLTVSGNISVNRNKVLNLGGASTIMQCWRRRAAIHHPYHPDGSADRDVLWVQCGVWYAQRIRPGSPLIARCTIQRPDIPKGYKLQGPARSLAQTNPLRTGDIYFKDVNGDGGRQSSDLGIIGTPYPKCYVWV